MNRMKLRNRGVLIVSLFFLLLLGVSPKIFASSIITATVQVRPPSIAMIDTLTPQINNTIITGLTLINEVIATVASDNQPAVSAPQPTKATAVEQISPPSVSTIDTLTPPINNTITTGLTLINQAIKTVVSNDNPIASTSSDEPATIIPEPSLPFDMTATENLAPQIDNNLTTGLQVMHEAVNSVVANNMPAIAAPDLLVSYTGNGSFNTWTDFV